MRTFYAVYDENDNFITCGYGAKQLGQNYNSFWSRVHRNKNKKKSLRVFKIPLQPQDDIFRKEDELFLKEEGDAVFFDREIAARENITLRSFYRRQKKLREKEKNNEDDETCGNPQRKGRNAGRTCKETRR